MSKSTATRDRILHEGLNALSRDGMAGVTLGGLADAVGMSKSGLFAHFRNKAELQLRLLDRVAAMTGPQIVEPAMHEPEGLPRLEALVRNWLGWARRAGLPGGCPIAAAMFELDDGEGPVRDRVVEMETQWRELLGQFVGQAVQRGHLRADLDVSQFVWELCGIYLGHHVAHRFVRAPDADERAAAAFASLIDRSKPQPGRPRRARPRN